MKKMITALVACGVLLVPATPAQAAPKDPVQALKSVDQGAGLRRGDQQDGRLTVPFARTPFGVP